MPSDPHRVRRLRWQAGACVPAQAFALRKLLRDQSDACQAAVGRAFDAAVPAGIVWRLPRLVLQLRAADLDELSQDLAQRVEAAARTALAQARQRLNADDGGPTPATAVAAEASTAAAATPAQQPLADAHLQALQHYLRSGVLPWTLAGLVPEQAGQALRVAATRLAERALVDAAGLASLLGCADTDRMHGALLRWLALLPPMLRRRLMAVHARGPIADAQALQVWRHALDDDAAEGIAAQALWLAGSADLLWFNTQLARQGVQSGVHGAVAPVVKDAAQARPSVPRLDREPAADTRQADAGSSPSRPLRGGPVPASEPQPTDPAQALLVPLAGLVLLHPWLPRLLGACKVLDEGATLVPPAQLARACAILCALACGQADAAEYQLPFVKLLLGRSPDEPLSAALPALEPADSEEIDALLGAVRVHWSALRGTAVEGLRLSFLQRRGLLSRGDGLWQLRMQTEAFDLLLAMLPWSISLVRLPWMPQPLVVEWPTP